MSNNEKSIQSLFRGGSIMYAIARRSTKNAISRSALVLAVTRATGASYKTIQSEISYMLNPDDPRNGNRVRGDARTSSGRVRLIAA